MPIILVKKNTKIFLSSQKNIRKNQYLEWKILTEVGVLIPNFWDHTEKSILILKLRWERRVSFQHVQRGSFVSDW